MHNFSRIRQVAPIYPTTLCRELCNKSSAVAQMGDRLATVDMGRKIGELCPLWGKVDPHITQCGLDRGLPSYQVAP